MIESDEESASVHLPYYINKYKDRIGEPAVVFCLNSGCLDYEKLWVTTSLRGCASCDSTVQVLNDDVHFGEASGIY